MSFIHRIFANISNPYKTAFIRMSQVEREETERSPTNPRSVSMFFRRGSDTRTYNAPVNEGDVAAIFVGDDSGMPSAPGFTIYKDAESALDARSGQLHEFFSENTANSTIPGVLTQTDMINYDHPTLPRHHLRLKTYCRVMLLANIPGVSDLEINTRLTVTCIDRQTMTIKCSYDCGQKFVILRRQSFNATLNNTNFTRYQFPIRLDYGLQHISHCSNHLDPMTYPLPFPHGKLINFF